MGNTREQIQKNTTERLLRPRIQRAIAENKIKPEKVSELSAFTSPDKTKEFNDAWKNLTDERKQEIFNLLPEEDRRLFTQYSERIASRVAANMNTDSGEDLLAERQVIAERRGNPADNREKQKEFEKYLWGEENSLSDAVINENNNSEDSGNSSNTGGNDKDPARVKKNYPKDPDWGHLDDDKFKITDGDIIEYLMKEVILESAAWGLNKVAGVGGIVVYEVGTGVLGGIGKGIKWGYSATKDAIGNYHADSTNENGNRTYCYQKHQEAVKDLNEKIEKINKIPTNKNALEFLTINRMIAKHFVRYEDGKLINESNDKLATNERFTKEYFEAIQKQADEFRIAEIKKLLKEKKNKKVSDKDIEAYFKKQLASDIQQYKASEGNDCFTQVAVPNKFEIADAEMLEIYNAAAKKYNDYMHAKPELTKIDYQSQLFAEYYSQYQIDKEYCEDAERNKSKIYRKKRNEEALEQERTTKALEAKKMFLQLEKARLEYSELKNKPESELSPEEKARKELLARIPSREELVEIAKKQSEKTAENIKKKKFDQIQLDELAAILNQHRKEKPLSLAEASKDTFMLDSLSEQIRTIDQAIAIYNAQIKVDATKRGNAHNAKVKAIYDVSDKEPSAQEMEKRRILSQEKALIAPNLSEEDFKLLIMTNRLVAGPDDRFYLQLSDDSSMRLIQDIKLKQEENGDFSHTILNRYDSANAIIGAAKYDCMSEVIKTMTAENKKLSKNEQISDSEINNSFSKYMKREISGETTPDEEKDTAGYKLYSKAMEKFKKDHQSEVDKIIKKIRNEPLNQPPKQQKSKSR